MRRAQGASLKACCRARPTAMIAISKSMAGAGGTEAQDWGRDAVAHVCALGPRRTATRSSGSKRAPARGAGLKSAHGQGQRRRRLWLAEDRERRATGWCASRRSTRQPARHTSFASAWVYPVIDEKIDIEILDKDLRIDTYPRLGRWRPARQQDRQRDPHHPSADQHRRAMSERTLAAPEPGACLLRCCAPRLYEQELQKREGRDRSDERLEDRQSAGAHQIPLLRPAALSDRQRPAHPASRSATPGRCSTATSTRFLGAALAQRIEGADARVKA